MALEYAFYASADLAEEDLIDFMAQVTGGQKIGNFVRSGALDMTPAKEDDPDDVSPIAEMLGFVHRLTITFRIANLASDDEESEATATMVRVVLSFFERYRGAGVLLLNGELVVMQCLEDRVVFDSNWTDWDDIPTVIDLLRHSEHRALAQPLY